MRQWRAVSVLFGIVALGSSTGCLDDAGVSAQASETAQTAGAAQAGGTRSLTVAWEAPAEKTDGSAIGALGSYRIHYGTAPGAYSKVVTLTNPSLTRYVIEGLAPGTYYVAMTALTSDGVESEYSTETVARLN